MPGNVHDKEDPAMRRAALTAGITTGLRASGPTVGAARLVDG